MLYERINKLCDEFGIKGSKLCDDVGISRSTITDLRSGRKKGVSAETALKIANYFDVSVDYLLEKTEQKKPLVKENDEERLKFALFNGSEGITDEMYEEVKQFAELVKLREEQKRK